MADVRVQQPVKIVDPTDNANAVAVNASDELTVSATNTGTFIVQEDGAALAALQLIDDAIFVDDTATHATGTTKGMGIMAVAVPTDAAIEANDIGMPAMSLDRRLLVDADIVASVAIAVTNAGTFVVQEDGAALTALQLIDNPVQIFGTDTYLEDTDSGMMVGVVRNDALATLANADNDIAPLQVNAAGALYVDISDQPLATGSATIGEVTIGAATFAAGDLAKREDDPHATLDVGVMALGVRTDAAAALAADGDYQPFIFDSAGRLHVADPNAGAGSPTNPTRNVATSAAVAAGTTVDLDSAEITEGEKLHGIDLSASVAFKALIRMVENTVDNPTHTIVFGQAGERVQWRPPNKDFWLHAGASGGVDLFQVEMTNMDTSEAADLYATFYYAT